MKHLIAILGLLFLGFLWLIPTYALFHGFNPVWSMMYILDFVLTVFFAMMIDGWYNKND